jgi:hypothetical protein
MSRRKKLSRILIGFGWNFEINVGRAALGRNIYVKVWKDTYEGSSAT